FIAEAEHDLVARAGADGAWLLHNPSPCATPGAMTLARLPLDGDEPPEVMAGHRMLRTQVGATRGGGRELLVECPAIAGRGWLALRAHAPRQSSATPQHDNRAAHAALTNTGGALLENALYRLVLDTNGEITSLIDKRVAGGRELLMADAGGARLLAFDDRPRRFGSWDFDAWDLDETYERKPLPLGPAELTLAESGPLRATIHVRRVFQQSVIEQNISLCRDQPRIDFATHIDWHEHHVLLKAAFPLDVRVTQARSEIQYGSIARPTHRNTSWDAARFETVAHRWVDLSESGYGVALLNDGRYGHDIQGSVVRLSLLRSPTFPDPEADQGAHDVVYSLLPHLGAWPQGDVVAHGYALNRPLRVVAPLRDDSPDEASDAPQPLFWLKDGAVVLEAVKRAAEGDDLIVRLYEWAGSRASASIHCALPIERVVEADLLERPLTAEASPAHADWLVSRAASHDAPAPRADGWTCAFRPFEIRTFRVTLRWPTR
ncbi:MAG TPA: glycoside hydrolase family 38 C-terminal domain-containing protein, partial [Ktedonobacterales bacterium]